MIVSRRAALGGLLIAGAAGPLRAADWRPSHAMEWIVPFPPGGSNDIFARPVAAQVGERLGQLLVVNPSLTFAPIVYPDSGFDLLRDFAAISSIARVSVALVINPKNIDAKDLAGFLAAARKSPGKINIGSSGLGTIPHLAIELLQQRTGIKLTHVPYRGGGQALQDMLAGQIDATFAPLSTVASYVQSGRLRALAVATAKREAIFPDVPTFAEAGVPDFEVSTWYGLFAPKATPDGPLDALHGAIQAALAAEDTKRIWAEQGARVDLESRPAFADFVRHEVERWSRIAKAVDIPME